MINKITLVGNIGNNFEVKRLPSGQKVANFSLATSEFWKDKNGEKQTRTEWHRIVVYAENLISIMEEYNEKWGIKLLYVEGSIRTRKYNDANGAEKTIVEVLVQGFNHVVKILQSKKNINGGSYDELENKSDKNNQHSDISESDKIVDDEIPF